MRRVLARHHVFEFHGCPAAKIDAPASVRRAVGRLCRRAGLHPVRRMEHRFSPHGLTVVNILRESHLAFSSWPEHGYAVLDLFLCGRANGLEQAVAAFGRTLGCARTRRRAFLCG